jgi:hypothetical protein
VAAAAALRRAVTILINKSGCPDLQAHVERTERRYAVSIGEEYIEDPPE